MKFLTIRSLGANDHLQSRSPHSTLQLDSPAISSLIDFRHYSPALVEEAAPAVEVAAHMLATGLHSQLVINHQAELTGLISLDELDEQYIMQAVAQGTARADVNVRLLMIPRSALKTMYYDELERTQVQDVLHALQHHGQRYLMVVQRSDGQIRGLISARDIGDRLHKVVVVHQTLNFADIVSAVVPRPTSYPLKLKRVNREARQRL